MVQIMDIDKRWQMRINELVVGYEQKIATITEEKISLECENQRLKDIINNQTKTIKKLKEDNQLLFKLSQK